MEKPKSLIGKDLPYEDQMEVDALVLCAGFTQHIHKEMDVKGFTKKKLEKLSGVNDLMSIFVGEREMTFLELAKLQHALGLTFKIEKQ